MVEELIESTMTKTGLRVKANIIKKVYKTGKKYAVNYKKEMQIKFDEKTSILSITRSRSTLKPV